DPAARSEITAHMNEWDFPHIVELELPPGGFRSKSFEFDALAFNLPARVSVGQQQRSVVIGTPVRLTPTMALDQVTARVQLNGQEVATGLGSAVLGNPLNSIAWLADKLGQYGRRLRPGDIIMTGSFVRQLPLGPGDIAVAEFSGIGRVEVKIAAA